MNDQVRLNPTLDPPPINVQVQSLVADLRDDSRLMRHFAITAIMTVALIAFEIFNFDTTRFALDSLIGSVRFMGFTWAAILAVAFCAIDFAGLFRLFSPDSAEQTDKYVGMLMGAWLLGATMNAVMTWWAVSLTLLANPYGNAVLSADVLLKVVPVFVAMLVWLTRVLFIGALNYSGEQFVAMRGRRNGQRVVEVPVTVVREQRQPVAPAPQPAQPEPPRAAPRPESTASAARLREQPARNPHTRRQPRTPKPAEPETVYFDDLFDDEPPVQKPRPRPSGGFRRPNANRQAKSKR